LNSIDPKYNVDRQRYTLGEGVNKTILSDDRRLLKDYGVINGSRLQFKDLGPQIGYQTVFFIEYLGPILIHALFYYYPEFFYGEGNIFNKILPFLFTAGPIHQKSFTQELVFYMVIAHFLKREFETAFIHKFSHATMPLFNLYKNCSHYWILGGFFLAYPSYHPNSFVVKDQTVIYIVAGLWLYAELSNFVTHVILGNLRKPGSTERKIPFGYGFNWVSCPNYFFEILSWIAVTILIPNVLSILFTVVGAVQMWFWAVKKHKQYRKDFGDKYPKRKVMIPFIA
jgi:very-long-chain enoyl-CoA reductase